MRYESMKHLLCAQTTTHSKEAQTHLGASWKWFTSRAWFYIMLSNVAWCCDQIHSGFFCHRWVHHWSFFIWTVEKEKNISSCTSESGKEKLQSRKPVLVYSFQTIWPFSNERSLEKWSWLERSHQAETHLRLCGLVPVRLSYTVRSSVSTGAQINAKGKSEEWIILTVRTCTHACTRHSHTQSPYPVSHYFFPPSLFPLGV